MGGVTPEMSDIGSFRSENRTLSNYLGVSTTHMSDSPNHNSILGATSGNVDTVLHPTPTQSALPTLGELALRISPERVHAVASVFSRFLCKNTKSRQFTSAYNLQRALAGYAVTDLASSPSLGITCATSDPATGLRRCGVTVADVKRAWQVQEDLDGADATLPASVLAAIFEPAIWDAAWAVIADGPGLAAQRLEKLLRAEATRTVAPNRARPKGGVVSMSHLAGLSTALKRFMKIAVDLNARGHSSGTLTSWTAVPAIEMPDAPSAVTDRSGPPLALLRAKWARLEAEIEQIFGAPVCDQLALVASLTERQKTRLFHRLRDIVAFGLLICFGPRRAAESTLLVADYERDKKLPDGSHGPAIVVTELKGRPETETSPKPIPEGLADRIDIYLAFLELRLGHPQPADAPLLIPTLTRPDCHWSLSAMSRWMSGRKAPGSTWKKAFLPRLDPSHPEYDAYDGYILHTIRDTVTQTIRDDTGKRWLTEHGVQSGSVFRVSISEATTDHQKITFDAYGYGGAKKPLYRELLSGYGAHIMWSAVTSESGARLIPDVDRFTMTLHKRVALESELERARQEEQRLAGQMPSTLAEATSIIIDNQRRTARTNALSEELRMVERELQALRDDRSAWVAVPDHVEDKDVPVIDLSQVEREFLEGVSPLRRRELKALRDWLTVTEFAYCADLGDATVRRWVGGKLPKAEHKRPWPTLADAPVDDSLGTKRRRIGLIGVNQPQIFDTDLKRQRLAEIRATWPAGWAEEHCLAPLQFGTPAQTDAAMPRLRAVS